MKRCTIRITRNRIVCRCDNSIKWKIVTRGKRAIILWYSDEPRLPERLAVEYLCERINEHLPATLTELYARNHHVSAAMHITSMYYAGYYTVTLTIG